MIRGRSVVGIIIAILGFAISMIEFVFRWSAELQHVHYDLDVWPIAFGMVVTFIGGFLIDRKGAKDAGGFVVDSGLKVLGVMRTGNRVTDPVITVTQAAEPVAPPAAPPP